MAEIHCIAPRIGADQAHNLGGSLKDLVARRADPQPGTDVGGIGARLARGTRAELARLGLREAVPGFDLDRLERAARLARSYDPPARPTTA